jgi:hypothetical protein
MVSKAWRENPMSAAARRMEEGSWWRWLALQLQKARFVMPQVTITHHAVRVLAAALLCCTLAQTARSQAPVERGKQTNQPAKLPQSESADAHAARERAAKRKKEIDAKDVNSVKSICSNC